MENTFLKDSRQVAKLLYGMSELLDEELTVITIAPNGKMIAVHNGVTKGTQSSVQISTKQIARLAVMDYAAGVIIAHNHPSGNPRPGSADIEQTAKLHKALEVLEISLTDHIIIGGDLYYSFSDEKLSTIN